MKYRLLVIAEFVTLGHDSHDSEISTFQGIVQRSNVTKEMSKYLASGISRVGPVPAAKGSPRPTLNLQQLGRFYVFQSTLHACSQLELICCTDQKSLLGASVQGCQLGRGKHQLVKENSLDFSDVSLHYILRTRGGLPQETRTQCSGCPYGAMVLSRF